MDKNMIQNEFQSSPINGIRVVKGERVRDCLIIAAGMGTRLAKLGDCKPLVELHGRPLIEWVIQGAAQCGLDAFHVVTGHQADNIKAALNGSSPFPGLQVDILHNPRWDLPNGLSVLAAAESLNRPFVLLMSDHIFDPRILARLIEAPPSAGDVTLVTDDRITDNPNVDLDDVTRVRVVDGLIEDIGKDLADYNAFDTGIFLCKPAIFDALDQSRREGDLSLSGGIRALARRGRASAFDAAGGTWVDVDDESTFRRAERLFSPGDPF